MAPGVWRINTGGQLRGPADGGVCPGRDVSGGDGGGPRYGARGDGGGWEAADAVFAQQRGRVAARRCLPTSGRPEMRLIPRFPLLAALSRLRPAEARRYHRQPDSCRPCHGGTEFSRSVAHHLAVALTGLGRWAGNELRLLQSRPCSVMCLMTCQRRAILPPDVRRAL